MTVLVRSTEPRVCSPLIEALQVSWDTSWGPWNPPIGRNQADNTRCSEWWFTRRLDGIFIANAFFLKSWLTMTWFWVVGLLTIICHLDSGDSEFAHASHAAKYCDHPLTNVPKRRDVFSRGQTQTHQNHTLRRASFTPHVFDLNQSHPVWLGCSGAYIKTEAQSWQICPCPNLTLQNGEQRFALQLTPHHHSSPRSPTGTTAWDWWQRNRPPPTPPPCGEGKKIPSKQSTRETGDGWNDITTGPWHLLW